MTSNSLTLARKHAYKGRQQPNAQLLKSVKKSEKVGKMTHGQKSSRGIKSHSTEMSG